jgi:hypothetical protein
MSDRSRVMTQTKRNNLVLQVGGLAWANNPTTPHSKKLIVTKVEQYCSTRQSPQRAVAPTEEEEEEDRHPTDSIIFIPQESTDFSKIHKPSSNSRRQNSDANRGLHREEAVL